MSVSPVLPDDKLSMDAVTIQPSPASLKLSFGLMVGMLMTASCSHHAALNHQTIFENIEKNRGNIVTSSTLSSKTNALLLSTGIDANDCIAQIDACITQLNKNFINKNDREALGLFAELHMAKVKAIARMEQCQEQVARPPISKEYANAPMPDEEVQKTEQQLIQCRHDYRHHALQAVKNSYAYLFYDALQSNSSNSNSKNSPLKNNIDTPVKNKPNHLATDLDIQTKDVYEAASNALIKQLYDTYSEDYRFIKDDVMDITYYRPDIFLKDNQITPLDNLTDPNKAGKLTKILNITYPDYGADTDTDTDTDTDIDTDIDTDFDTGTDTSIDINRSQQPTQPLSTSGKPISLNLYLPNEPEYLDNAPKPNHRIGELYASHDLNFTNLNTISKREGLGVSYVSLFPDRQETSVTGLIRSKGRDLNAPEPKDRIHLTGNVLLTGIIVPKADTLDGVLASRDLDIKMYNPHHTESVSILGQPYYLAANFSASYDVWLAENSLDNVGYFSLLSKQQSLILPQLYMLEPYDPNKRIIIMLHGLASSPATWVKITNDISNDDALRDSYQVWQIFYPTNIPILENRYQIQKLIETAYQHNDPQGKHLASEHSILIGHSMGAVIGRMMLSNEDLEAKMKTLQADGGNQHLNTLINMQIDEQNIRNRLHLHKLKSVDDAVFISAPFRGTDFADRWFTRTMRRIIQLPLGFVKTITGNLSSIATEGELADNPLGALYLQNGASQLSDQSSFMQLTADLQIDNGVTYHSIIANRDSDLFTGLQQLKVTSAPSTQLSDSPDLEQIKTSLENSPNLGLDVANPPSQNAFEDISDALTANISDGIVPYSSSHLEGASSETIISGGHSIQETPEAVLTLRKLLHEHLKKYPVKN